MKRLFALVSLLLLLPELALAQQWTNYGGTAIYGNSGSGGVSSTDQRLGYLRVRAATTGVLPNAPSYSGTPNFTLTAGSNVALAAQDGVTLAVNDRLLVQNQATASQNGIYALTQAGSGSVPWILTRTSDFNASALITPAVLVAVSEGTVGANSLISLTTAAPITLDTAALTFAQIYGLPVASSIKLGPSSASGTGTQNVAIGAFANVTAANSAATVVGYNAQVSASSGTAIGNAASVTGTGGIAIGRTSVATAQQLAYGSATANLSITDVADFNGINGQVFHPATTFTEVVNTTSGTSVNSTNQIPAGACVFYCSARVTTTITGPANWQYGVAGDLARFGSALALASGTTVTGNDITGNFTRCYNAATNVAINTTGSAFTAGAVRLTCVYSTNTPPSS